VKNRLNYQKAQLQLFATCIASALSLTTISQFRTVKVIRSYKACTRGDYRMLVDAAIVTIAAY